MSSYPVRLDARLEAPVSRWLWLVKWILLIPHYIVLFFLGIAAFVVTVIAFFAILITTRYPRALFDFNLGVLRWGWRVHYYGYGALGTDRYPPFSLDEHPEYPATLYIDYPEQLSRGLVLVKWWLLAIPHYLIISFFLGGGGSSYQQNYGGTGLHSVSYTTSYGLTGLLVLIVGIGLLFTTRYLTGLYDVLLGMARWIARVYAYAVLMTDQYPPFRLDLGATDPNSPPPAAPGTTGVAGEAAA